MNILIIGAGAIGTLVGAKLALADHRVTLVGRQRFADAITGRGLHLRDDDGHHRITRTAAVPSIRDAFGAGESYDYAVMSVKSYDTVSAAGELVQAAPEGRLPTVVSLQNGVGNEERIGEAIGPAHVIAGTITTPVSTLGPGEVQVEKPDYCLGLSRWHPAVASSAFDAANASLSAAGFSVTLYPNAQEMKWTKLLMNMVGNASCAILDMPPDRLFADPELTNLEIDAWRETLASMKAAGFAPVNLGSYPFSLLAPLIRNVPRPVLRRALRKSVGSARGGKMPSLHMDLESGRSRSEVLWLNGATVRKGREHDVPTPVNRMLTDVLLRVVEDPAERENWRRRPERLLAAAAEYRSAEVSRAG